MKCRHCGKPFTKKEIEQKRIQKSDRIKAARKEEIGRGESRVRYDYGKIIELRKSGLSIKAISLKIGCSTTPVQQALKKGGV